MTHKNGHGGGGGGSTPTPGCGCGPPSNNFKHQTELVKMFVIGQRLNVANKNRSEISQFEAYWYSKSYMTF